MSVAPIWPPPRANEPNVMFGGWFQVRPNVYGCVAAKCGSQSLKRAAFGVNKLADVLEVRKKRIAIGDYDIGPFTPWEVAQFEGRKVLGIREPVDRFSALWRDKALSPTRTKHEVKHAIGGMSPDELIAHIESQPFGDSHYFPQCAYLVPGVELVRHDAIYAALGLESVRLNARPGDVPQLPHERIRAHYNADVRLWKAVCGSS